MMAVEEKGHCTVRVCVRTSFDNLRFWFSFLAVTLVPSSLCVGTACWGRYFFVTLIRTVAV